MKRVSIFVFAFMGLLANAGNQDVSLSEIPNEDYNEESTDRVKRLTEISLYEFEFRFLPMLASNITPDEETVLMLSDCTYLMRELLPQYGCYVALRPKEIEVEVVGEGEESVVVWKMPKPVEMPLAAYIAFVPYKESDTYKYKVFYLELSINFDGEGSAWVLGVMNDDGHANYGNVKAPKSAIQFVNLITKFTKKKH